MTYRPEKEQATSLHFVQKLQPLCFQPTKFDSPKTLLGQEAKIPLPLEGAGVDPDDVVDGFWVVVVGTLLVVWVVVEVSWLLVVEGPAEAVLFEWIVVVVKGEDLVEGPIVDDGEDPEQL